MISGDRILPDETHSSLPRRLIEDSQAACYWRAFTGQGCRPWRIGRQKGRSIGGPAQSHPQRDSNPCYLRERQAS